MRNFALSFDFLFLSLVTSWPNHHHQPLFIHLRCIKHKKTAVFTAFTSSIKPQLLFRGHPAAAGSGWKFRRRTLWSRRDQRSLPVSDLPASSQTQTAAGESNGASRRSQTCSGWFWILCLHCSPVHSAFLSGCWTTCALWRGLWPLTWRVCSWRKESCAARRRKQAGWTQLEEEEERREVSARSSSATTLLSTVRWERGIWLVGLSAGNRNPTS